MKSKIILITIISTFLMSLPILFYTKSSVSSSPDDRNYSAVIKKDKTAKKKKGKGAVSAKNKKQKPIPHDRTILRPKIIVIKYKSEGFSPVKILTQVGDTVRFENNSDMDMWPASDIHPTHQIYPEFDSKKSIPPRDNYSFIFNKVGVWNYHNHLNPRHTGKIFVCEENNKQCPDRFSKGDF